MIGRLALGAAVGAGDLGQIELVAHQRQHETGEMVLVDEVPDGCRQNHGLIDFPGAECLAHGARQNLTRSPLASAI